MIALTAICYNIGFFTILAAGPFALPEAGIIQIGWVFFGWGVLLALTSVVVAPVVQRRFGTLPSMIGTLVSFLADLVMMAVFTKHPHVVVAGIVASGAFIGINNTLIIEAVMGAAPVERPAASAAYSFVRFTGGAVGPYVALKLGEKVSPHAPFWFGRQPCWWASCSSQRRVHSRPCSPAHRQQRGRGSGGARRGHGLMLVSRSGWPSGPPRSSDDRCWGHQRPRSRR